MLGVRGELGVGIATEVTIRYYHNVWATIEYYFLHYILCIAYSILQYIVIYFSHILRFVYCSHLGAVHFFSTLT